MVLNINRNERGEEERKRLQEEGTEQAKAPTEESCEHRKLKEGLWDWSIEFKGSTGQRAKHTSRPCGPCRPIRNTALFPRAT